MRFKLLDRRGSSGEIWSDISGPSSDELGVVVGSDYTYLAGPSESKLRQISRVVFLYIVPLVFGFAAGTVFLADGHPFIGAFGYALGVFAACSFSGMNRVRVFHQTDELEKSRVFIGCVVVIWRYDLKLFDCVDYQVSGFQGKFSSQIELVGTAHRVTVASFYDFQRRESEVVADIKAFTAKFAESVSLPQCCDSNKHDSTTNGLRDLKRGQD